MPDLLIGALLKGSSIVELHSHDVTEIILVTEGEGVRTVNNTQISFHPGNIIVTPPNVPHRSHSDSEYTGIFIQTDRPLPLPDSAERQIVLEDEDNAVAALMQMMLYRYIKGEKEDSALSLMLDLVLQLLAEKCDALERDPVVEEVCRLLALHYNDPQLSVSALLLATGYNKDYIRRRFISARGVTPSEYLTSLRIEHAKRLLRSKTKLRLSVSDIGAMCGYYDPHYFSRIFKKQTGLTPEAFAALPAE